MSEFFCEPLAKRHDRKRFQCGIAELDAWFRERARQDQERHVAAVFVLVPVAEPNRVAGFYTLSATSVQFTDLPAAVSRRLPRYPNVPAILIGRLARDESFPGIGSRLLFDALQRIARNVDEVAAAIVVVDAKSERAADFYRSHGFQSLSESPPRLYVTMKTVMELIA